ncbi:MAG: tetratricopeptide repeat protein [Bacteroidetes bacterium]|nr:tetratricopeptide repeat protein [Bacteroidota bacterium]
MRYSVIILSVLLFMCGCTQPSAEQLFEKAQGAQKAQLIDEALETYIELIRLYPDSTQTPDAYYAVGFLYQNYKNDVRTALTYYKTLVEKFPSHPTASNAAFIIGFLYANELKQYDSAKLAYELFLERYPDSPVGLIESAREELKNLGKDPTTILSEAQQSKHQTSKRLKK